METFFLLFGVFSFSWYITKFLFWLEEPPKRRKPQKEAYK